MIRIILLSLHFCCCLRFSFCQTNQKDFPVLKGPYFGQKPPGIQPELFAPEIMNNEVGYHSTIIFSPDMTEAFWSPMERGACLIHSEVKNGVWTKPEYIDFGHKNGIGDAVFSPDGKKLFFISTEPPKEGDSKRERIWFVERNNNEWSSPQVIDENVSMHPTHWTFSLAMNGNLYFTSEKPESKGINLVKFNGENYEAPVKLFEGSNPCIAIDESFLIYMKKTENAKADLFIRFKNDDEGWSDQIELGSGINTVYNNLCPSLSPDGKYLFYLSQVDGWNRIFWISAEIICELKP